MLLANGNIASKQRDVRPLPIESCTGDRAVGAGCACAERRRLFAGLDVIAGWQAGGVQCLGSGNGNAVSRMARASDTGDVSFAMLPFGRYTVHVTATGFAPARQELEISSGIPEDTRIVLGLAPVTTTVAVSQSPYPVMSTVRRNPGREQMDMTSPQPARGTIDLVRSEPGWLLGRF